MGSRFQNTKAAFKNAVDSGVKYLETDVILTKDKKVVAFHGSQNFFMEKKTGLLRRKIAQNMTYEELRSIDNYKDTPLFGDLLLSFPDAFFSVDVKTDDVVGPLCDEIKRAEASNRLCITSFSLSRTLRSRQLLRLDTDYDRASLCIYSWQALLIKFVSHIYFKYLHRKGIGIVQIPYKQISNNLLKTAHAYQIEVYAWTVNDVESWLNTPSYHADAVISDYPERFIKA